MQQRLGGAGSQAPMYPCRVPEGTIGETYLVVPVESAQAAVRAIGGEEALPAHVTALGPFAPPGAITPELGDAIRGVAAAVMPWDVTFRDVRAFDDGTLWLAPEDDAPFRALTAALWRSFPQYPPYGGAFVDVIPHLTLQERSDRSRSDAVRTLTVLLPIRSRIDTLELWIVRGDGIEVASRWS
jgi:2'-5' RNA ligase superfamily